MFFLLTVFRISLHFLKRKRHKTKILQQQQSILSTINRKILPALFSLRTSHPYIAQSVKDNKMNHADHDNDESSTANLNINIPTPTSYREHLDATMTGESTAAGTFVYEDDMSEMNVPPTPLIASSRLYSPLGDDSVQDRASVGSSFMNYTYSEDFGDDSTITTVPRAEEATSSLVQGAVSINASTTHAEIQSPCSSRPPRLNVADIMQTADGLGLPRQRRKTLIPPWIANASNSIKFVIVMSTALLIASLALVSITATVSSTSNNDGGVSNNEVSQQTPHNLILTLEPTASPTVSVTPIPTAADIPVMASPPSEYPTGESSTSPSEASYQPTTIPSSPSTFPFVQSSESPTIAIGQPTVTPSMVPTAVFSATPSKATEQPTVTPSVFPTVASSETPSKGTDQPTATLSTTPTLSQSSMPSDAASGLPTQFPSTKPSKRPSILPSVFPSISISESPSLIDSNSPTVQPSYLPSMWNESIYYTLSISHRNKDPDNMIKMMKTLPTENRGFLVHLGNWNVKNPEKCKENAYKNTAKIYSNSSIPVFFVPGKYEWNRCPDEEKSHQYWRDNFVDYESKHWENMGYVVARQPKRPENFAFAYRDVLYIGLNMVGYNGEDPNDRSWAERLEDNLEWAEESVAANKDVELVVMFGSTGPTRRNRSFFDQISKSIEAWTEENPALHVLFVKQGQSKMKFKPNLNGLSNFFLFHTQSNHWPPTKTTVTEFHLMFDDEEWYQEFEGDLL